LSLIRDRIALGGSGFDIRGDESAYFSSSVTALIEAIGAKGTATALGSSLDEMEAAGRRLGREAVARALKLRDGERAAPGTYRVVIGPQPLAEIINYMVLPSLTTHAFQAATSAYYGRFGRQVMDDRLSLIDDPLAKNGALRRRLTCEGLPAGKTTLIENGRLTGLLSTFYDTHRLLSDDARDEKLGSAIDGDESVFAPRSAYRFGESLARRFDARPNATGTNVIMTTRGGVSEDEMLAAVGNGLYVGRVWYTYPINGQRAGDFTCTISGDSHVIKGGRLGAALAPNCLRINANIGQIFSHPLALARRSQPSLVWGSVEAYYVPAIAVDAITVTAVAPP
ncbi:MAG: metallopeptidase TldD-related protein, partial [Candidatus Binataceae bacterium]